MAIFYYARTNSGGYIFDNFPPELIGLVDNFKETYGIISIKFNNEEQKARMGSKSNKYGSIVVLTTDSKYLNRFKIFKELLELSLIALEPLSNFQNKLTEQHTKRNQEFIHNLTSLNTSSILDLYTLIPEKVLTGNKSQQEEAIKKILNDQPNVTVKTLLKQLKYALAMKVEFSVFERSSKEFIVSRKMDQPIRQIVLSVLQMFQDEFEDNRIELHLEACERRISVDHDSLLVSLYYLIENSIKYCCKNTKYKIFFNEEADCFSVSFKMISIRIEESEVEKLSIRGYRSNLARELNATGNGIGMYRIIKTLAFNDAELEVIPRINDMVKKNGNIIYEGNQFKIKFMGQQDWFKVTNAPPSKL